MILVVGASGRLGSAVTRELLANGEQVRALARDPSRMTELARLGADVVRGDIRDAKALAKACQGADRVVACVQALDSSPHSNNPRTVDRAGNRKLVDAAKAAGVKRFVFISAYGAASNAPLGFLRMKYQAEEYLKASGLDFSIIRPAAFMEFWATLVGDPVLKTGKTAIFGRGKNPISFVSVDDVAHLTVAALTDPTASRQTLNIGGPENLTMEQVAHIFERVSGKQAKMSHVPRVMMRVMSRMLGPVKPALTRQMRAGIWMDTANQVIDSAPTLRNFPMQRTALEEVVRARSGAQVMSAAR